MLRKLFFLLIFIVIVVASAAFAAFNVEPVTINFYFFAASLPLSAIIVIAILLGIILGATILSLGTIKLRYQNNRLQKKLSVTEQELSSLRLLPIKDEQ